MNKQNKKLKVLISAYACEPGKGSEPGVGWNWVNQIAKFADTWVVTRANNKETIVKELQTNPAYDLHFIYADLPKWMRFWKRGQRGVHLYYYLWQFAAYMRVKSILKSIKFDISHHITFVNDWLASFLALLQIPFIWGPIGSHAPMSGKFLPHRKSQFLETSRLVAQTLFRLFDPFFYLTIIRARSIITINGQILLRFPFRLIDRRKFHQQQANAIEVLPMKRKRKNTKLRIISVGRLIYLKGFHLALSAFSDVSKVRNHITLDFIGDGMERKNLQKSAHELGVGDHVNFVSSIARSDVLKQLADSDIFLFPSFEGGGMVVLEAMASGLPVVCLDYGGPGEMVTKECGIRIRPITVKQTIKGLADALLKLANNPDLRKKMGDAARKRAEEVYSWDKKGEFIKELYESVLSNESSSYS